MSGLIVVWSNLILNRYIKTNDNEHQDLINLFFAPVSGKLGGVLAELCLNADAEIRQTVFYNICLGVVLSI